MRGRTRELHLAGRVLERARRGTTSLLCIEGAAGVGKSTLLEALLAEAASSMRVIRLSGVESPWYRPYEALDVLMDSIDAQLDVPEEVGALELSEAVIAAMGEAATDEPLVVAVDDSQWVDPATMRVLELVARRAGSMPLAIILAARPPIDRTRYPDADLLSIEPLDREAAAGVLADLLPKPVAPNIAERILHTALGNPLAIRELVSSLTPGQLEGSELVAEPLALEKNPCAPRIDAFTDESVRALAVVAADGSGRIDRVSTALDELGIPQRALVEPEDDGVLVRSTSALRFAHPLLRSAAYHAVSPAARRAAHAALANVHTGGTRVWHRVLAHDGSPDELATALAEEGAAAERRGAIHEATTAFERAAQITTDDSEACDHFVRAAQLATATGDAARAVQLASSAKVRMTTPLAELRVALATAQAEQLANGDERAESVLVAVMDAVEGVCNGGTTAAEERAACENLLLLWGLQLMRVDDDAARTTAAKVRLLSERSTDAAVQRSARFAALVDDAIAAHAPPTQLGDLLDEMLTAERVDRLGSLLLPAAHALRNPAMADEAIPVVEDLLSRARTRRSDAVVAELLYVLSILETGASRFTEATHHALEAADLADALELRPLARRASSKAAGGAAVVGDWPVARERWEAVLAETTSRDRPWGEALRGLALLDYYERHAELAIARLEQLHEHLIRGGRPNLAHGVWEQDLAQCYVATGRVDDAAALASGLRAAVERDADDYGAAVLAWIEAMLAPPPERDARYRHALELLAPWPLTSVRVLGAWADAQGDDPDGEARRRLAEAHTLAVAFGAHGPARWISTHLGQWDDVNGDSTSAGSDRSIGILGPLVVDCGSGTQAPPGGRGRTILSFLALRRRAHIDEVVDVLWPDSETDVGRTRLRNVLTRLRRSVGDVVTRVGDFVELDRSVRVDLDEFELLARDARAGELGALDAAIRLFRGDLLADHPYDDWALAPRERVRRTFLSLLDEAATRAAELGDIDQAVAHVERAIELDPFDADRFLDAARMLFDSGNRSAALDMVTRAESALAQLGLPPSSRCAELRTRTSE